MSFKKHNSSLALHFLETIKKRGYAREHVIATSEEEGDGRESIMDTDDFLDFESDDQLLRAPVFSKKSNKKVIGLDDLLADHYKEKSQVIERKYKRAKSRKNDDSDDDDKESLLSKKINECHEQMKDVISEEEVTAVGIQMFGDQGTLPSLSFPELGHSSLLQSFMQNKLNNLVELTPEKGETFLEGLLVNGWLLKLVSKNSHLESAIAKWSFNLMLYSPKEELSAAACDFWCIIISTENKAEVLSLRIEWFPEYSELKRALETYGFLFDFSSHMECTNTISSCRGPPKNIRSWMKFVAACFCVRAKQPIFSSLEAAELLEVTICLFLDRRLQGLSLLLHKLLQSAISYFTNEEWNTCCEQIARSLACRLPKDLNCLCAVECISGVSNRSNHLRSAVSFQILLLCFGNEAKDEEEILNLLISINVKDKDFDLFKMYIYLVLTEKWLLSNSTLESKPVINEMWGVYLRNCACQINSTDFRPYASKVRTKASYLLHGTVKK